MLLEVNQANLLFRNKDYAGALTAYTSALDMPTHAGGSNRALLLRNRSSCLFELGRYDEAVANAEEAISIEPEHVTMADKISRAGAPLPKTLGDFSSAGSTAGGSTWHNSLRKGQLSVKTHAYTRPLPHRAVYKQSGCAAGGKSHGK